MIVIFVEYIVEETTAQNALNTILRCYFFYYFARLVSFILLLV